MVNVFEKMYQAHAYTHTNTDTHTDTNTHTHTHTQRSILSNFFKEKKRYKDMALRTLLLRFE